MSIQGTIYGLEGVVIILATLLMVVGIVTRSRGTFLLLAVLLLFVLTGCAALPMPLQPKDTTYNSNAAEVTYLAIEAVDTAQTMHLRPGTSCDHEADPFAAFLYGGRNPAPGRVLVTNLALLTGHAMVTSWLDDKVAEHATDGEGGPWYVGRAAWHIVSIGAASAAVANNAARGCRL